VSVIVVVCPDPRGLEIEEELLEAEVMAESKRERSFSFRRKL
jgi:hypothetical protein